MTTNRVRFLDYPDNLDECLLPPYVPTPAEVEEMLRLEAERALGLELLKEADFSELDRRN
jgi:hypothetical protein